MKTIKVLQKHIKKARVLVKEYEYSARYCPIALAIQEQLKDKNLLVRSRYFVTMENIYNLPKRAQNFIVKFDNNKPVKPFSFKINV